MLVFISCTMKIRFPNLGVLPLVFVHIILPPSSLSSPSLFSSSSSLPHTMTLISIIINNHSPQLHPFTFRRISPSHRKVVPIQTHVCTSLQDALQVYAILPLCIETLQETGPRRGLCLPSFETL